MSFNEYSKIHQNIRNLSSHKYIQEIPINQRINLFNTLINESKNKTNSNNITNLVKKYKPIMSYSTFENLMSKHKKVIHKYMNNADFQKLNQHEQYVELQRLLNLLEKSNKENINYKLSMQPRQLIMKNVYDKNIGYSANSQLQIFNALQKIIKNDENIKARVLNLKRDNVSNIELLNRVSDVINKKHKHVFMKYELNNNTFKNKNGVLKDLKNIIELEKNSISYIPPKRHKNNNSLNRYLMPRTNRNNNYINKNTKQINSTKNDILNVFLVRHCYSCANKMKKGGFLNKYFKRHFISPHVYIHWIKKLFEDRYGIPE